MYELKISRNGDVPTTTEYPSLLDAMRAVDVAAETDGLTVRIGTTHMHGFLVDACEAIFRWEIAVAHNNTVVNP